MMYKLKDCDVIEVPTGQVIRTYPKGNNKDPFLSARPFLKHLNSGGGFDGWSPSFIFTKIR